MASQLTLDLPKRPAERGWGGKREGAGRPRVLRRSSVAHRTRPRLPAKTPVHVTMRIDRAGIRTMRCRAGWKAVQIALLTACERRIGSFRVVHVSIQRDHLHLLVEASNRTALSR